MKNINKSTVIIGIAMLSIGLFLGWLAFGKSSETRSDEHNHSTETKAESIWTCSMHPQIRQKEEGQCPICGMDLIPLESDNNQDDPMEIKMSPTAMQLANVQTEIVRKQVPVNEIRLNGKIQSDESRVYSQTTHISGRIENLFINTTGEYVNKGQTIALVYSPELVSAQKELFEAHKIKDDYPEIFEAAKEKLKNWKLSNNQINEILERGYPIEEFPILSDLNGVILQKKVNLGDHLKQGQSLFEIADLSKVWVLFDVYESDIPWVKTGDEIAYTVQSLPNEVFKGKIEFIDPIINQRTRVAKARIVTDNPNNQLKPEMFVSGILYSKADDGSAEIVLPKSAVMWTGERSVVYVKTKNKEGVNFIMRTVSLGASLNDKYIITKGLLEGEEVATNGTFSIDAAAQLAGKPSMMNPEGGKAITGHNHGGSNMDMTSNSSITENQSYSTTEKGRKQLEAIFDNYLELSYVLIDDDFSSIKKTALSFSNSLSEVDMTQYKGDAHNAWMTANTKLTASIKLIESAKDIDKARDEFVNLSKLMIHLAKVFKPTDFTLYIQHCPMANKDNGADWLSKSKPIKNPYFGKSMLKCGETTDSIIN